jgi:uncharacterized protein YcaQ
MTPETISLLTARDLVLAAQVLAHPPPHPAAKSDVLAAIRHMGYLQIDTISVVARSLPGAVEPPGRLPPPWLDSAGRGALFGWAHAMLCPSKLPLYRRAMIDGVYGWNAEIG